MTGIPPKYRPRENTLIWMLKIIAGLMLVVLLGLHYIVNHLIVPGGLLSYADVVRYFSNPIIPVIEISFLIFVVAHALLGLRSIILDLNPSYVIIRIIDILLLLAGFGAIAYGIWLTFTIAGRSALL